MEFVVICNMFGYSDRYSGIPSSVIDKTPLLNRFQTRKYSEIPLLRPPKIKTSYLLETLFAKFKLCFSSFSTPSVPLIRDHFWDCPKVVFNTPIGQPQRWS